MSIRVLSPADARALTAAQNACALFGRDDRVAVVVTGPDRAKLLHNLLTQQVKDLDVGAVRPAALCDPQGRMQAAMTLVVQAERIVLWTARAQAESLAATLDRYIIMDDAEAKADEDLALVTVVGPHARMTLASLQIAPSATGEAVAVHIGGKAALAWLGTTGGKEHAPWGAGLPEISLQLQRDDLSDVAEALIQAGVAVGCHAAADVLRILAGDPLLGPDLEDGSTPLEAGIPDTVNYRKGCYMGQEAIAMMTYRGQLRRHLCWVELDGDSRPETGWTLRTADGRKVGRMGSGIVKPDGYFLGLAMVQRKGYEPGAVLTAGPDQPATDSPAPTAALRIVGSTVAGVF